MLTYVAFKCLNVSFALVKCSNVFACFLVCFDLCLFSNSLSWAKYKLQSQSDYLLDEYSVQEINHN